MSPAIGPLRGAATGGRGAMLGLALKCLGLTVATGGLYGFWARTRLRRRLWASVHLGGAPFEYDGRPLEKLMGFAIAALIVGAYLGLVVMAFLFLSLQWTRETAWGTAAAVAAMVPLYFFAQYRGLRYLLSRSRWRGLAFGLEPGAWGYAWRATLWTGAAVATLGLLWPLRARALWAFRARRARWGDAAIGFAAALGPLYRAWIPVQIVALLGAGAVASEAGFLVLLALLGLSAAWVHWRVAAFGHLASGLTLNGTALSVAPRSGRVFAIQIGGWLAVGAILLLAVPVLLGTGIAGLAGAVSSIDLDDIQSFPLWAVALTGLAIYVTVFLLRGALRLAFVTLPTVVHLAETAALSDARAPDRVARGPRDGIADADGFATLFDFGSAV